MHESGLVAFLVLPPWTFAVNPFLSFAVSTLETCFWMQQLRHKHQLHKLIRVIYYIEQCSYRCLCFRIKICNL